MVKVPLLSCTLGVLLLLSVGWLPYRAELSSLYEDGELTTVSRETGGLAPASDACFLRGTADPTYPIIDPVLLHSTSLGGSSKDEAWSIAVDREGNTYISGITHSPDFPGTTLGGNAAEKNVFVAKYTPTGELAYATVIGGESGEEGNAIAVDDYGNAYVAGETYSTSFPLLNPWRSAFGYEEAFLLKFDAAGQLSYSTFIGGTLGEEVNDIVADAVGNVYLGGEVYSDDYPLLNPWSATTYGDDDEDAFITIFDAAGEMAYSTLISASSRDQVFRIAVDDEGYVYGTGMTSSPDFPTVNAFQTTYGGEWDDCFVFKLDPWRNEMLYSTLLGGNGRDECWGIAVDDEGSAYVTGFTSSNNFPLAKPIQSSLAGSDDVFITKLSPTGDQLLFSTYIGGEGRDRAWDLALDGGGNVYVVGETDSPDFPTVDAIQGHHRGEMDGFLLVLDQANTIRYASYIGGFDYDRAYSIALDENWIVHVAGATDSTDFPRTDGAAAFAGNTDAFVAQYGLVPTPTPTPTPIPQAAATVGPEGG
ncbi:MAG: SBBP repeat-containing protein, partial [Anaerolineae bacterium]